MSEKMPGPPAPQTLENVENLPREEQERLALESVINERVNATATKDSSVDKQKLRESMMRSYQMASSVPKMEEQINQSYKEQYESGLKAMLDELKILQLKVPKSKEERDKTDNRITALRKEIELQKKAIAERG
jgi:hypothetical protein